jgi:16S rRNA processing protein RimM
MTSAELIAIGRIGPAHGNRGEAYVEPWTDAPEERFAAGTVLLTSPEQVGPLTVATHRFQGDRLLVQFVGVQDRDSVVALRATQLLVPAGARPLLADPDEFYDSDLVGLSAVTITGTDLGPVLDVIHLAGAVYLLFNVAGVERMVPFVASIVPEVDLDGGRIVVDPPDGLFDL